MPTISPNWTICRKPRTKTIWQVHSPDGTLVCECSSEAFASLIAKLLQNETALRNVSCSTNPDVSVNASFVPYGYQMDILVNGGPRSIACRDFAGTLDINGRPFSMDLSPWAATHPDTKRVPANWFVLPVSAILREEDQFHDGDRWTETNYPGTRAGRQSYPYIRPISADPGLHNRMQAYAKGERVPDGAAPAATPPQDLDAALAAAKEQCALLEKQVKERDEIKVGDWVVRRAGDIDPLGSKPVPQGPIQVSRIESYTFWFDLTNDGWFKERFRKATLAEIAVHLEEARKVTITVEGTAYEAVYHEGFVQFGCARIDNGMIRAAADLTARLAAPLGTRVVKAVQIGKGLFTEADLDKLALNLVDPKPAR